SRLNGHILPPRGLLSRRIFEVHGNIFYAICSRSGRFATEHLSPAYVWGLGRGGVSPRSRERAEERCANAIAGDIREWRDAERIMAAGQGAFVERDFLGAHFLQQFP